MTPLEKYHHDLQQPDFEKDATQANAIKLLDNLFQRLIKPQTGGIFGLFKKQPALTGLYLYGTVGAGKTYLMDTFYECLPFKEKLRQHFHVFMRDVHEQLKVLQGETDPLKKLAKQLREQAKIICFDEFVVHDIADAMLLGRLLTALFEQGVVLVATSNLTLDELYKDGLQRERFLPAIKILKDHLQEIKVGRDVDYRQQTTAGNLYFTPLNENTVQHMGDAFRHYAKGSNDAVAGLKINQRAFQSVKCTPGVIWFEFAELCQKPCGAPDYLSIAKQFYTVLLSNVPVLDDKDANAAQRFINLIDVFYDEQIRLIISAAKPISLLYQGNQSAFEFQRTASRLTEMQSIEYLEKTLAKKYSAVRQL